ncbi:MAG: spermidine synthase [Candidatus Moraniibacteriota bacterium]|nr:MAG: spermidine synthase [Candidatus Moranbacteria bacterium]
MQTVNVCVDKKIPVNKERLLTFLFGFCMFSTGGAGLVNEYILATMTTYILGNSIEQFSIVIAAMMLMMGLSGWVQEKISDEYNIEKFIIIETLLAILGGFAPIAIYAAYGFFTDHFVFVHYFFVLSIGFLIGFEIPIVMRIINQYGIGIKKNLKIVYAMDYIGAFVFAIVWITFLLKHFPLTEISFFVNGFNFFVACVTIGYFVVQNVIVKRRVVILVLIATALSLVYGYMHNRSWNVLMEQKFYDDPIVHVETTKYQHLVLTQDKKRNDVRLYINGATQFSSTDEKRYHELLVHPAMTISHDVKNVLILGGGDGLALREVLKYRDVKSVTLADLDPDMVKFASTHPIMRKLNRDSFADARVFVRKTNNLKSIGPDTVYLQSDTVHVDESEKVEFVAQVDVYHVDADRFLSELHGKKWDVIIIDFPDPSSVELAKLYSREFYRKLQWIMHDDTIVAIQSTSPYHAKEAFLTIQRTMNAAGLKTIPYRQNIPSFGDWGYMLAWRGAISVKSMKDKIRDVDNFHITTDFITPDVMIASMAFGKNELVSKNTCVNSLMMPCLLNQYIDYGWAVE